MAPGEQAPCEEGSLSLPGLLDISCCRWREALALPDQPPLYPGCLIFCFLRPGLNWPLHLLKDSYVSVLIRQAAEIQNNSPYIRGTFISLFYQSWDVGSLERLLRVSFHPGSFFSFHHGWPPLLRPPANKPTTEREERRPRLKREQRARDHCVFRRALEAATPHSRLHLIDKLKHQGKLGNVIFHLGGQLPR